MHKFGAQSKSDKTNTPLKFSTESQAQNHVDNMNKLREEWGINPIWNLDYWKTKPDEWIVVNL